MHIAFLTPEYSHPSIPKSAGIGTSIKNLVTSLHKSGNDITIFIYDQPVQEIIDDNGVKIHRIKRIKYKFFGWYLYRKHIEKYCSKIIKQENIAIIEAADWTGITAFMHFKIPLVIRFHGSDTYFCHLENRKQKLKNFWFEKLAINKAQAFIAPTTFAGEVSKRLFKIKGKEIKTIHNGLNLQSFENEKPEEFETNLILYAGTLIRKKGVLELPKIFKEVQTDFPDAKLILIGGDAPDIKTDSKSTWELMKTLFAVDGLKNVNYLGKIPYSEMQNYIKKANVCVFPTFAETLGMVTIESMAMQKVVVNSNIGWSEELIIDGESGFLVHPSNHDLYAKRIKQVFEDRQLAQKIREGARARVEEKFDINKLLFDNIDFYQKIINLKKRESDNYLSSE
ncbi:glycosyltransferase family 4 protein [Flavobacterium humidisoli]|uniref:Glycosyltransferase family 4 protein n=1 Tax=Flavobacterium humidisoli TaxID=2937442 RepID=A0ABY4LUY1_9FLAO|nr:glycosyltransferase family 4 protein [Flavobacterium humidisoli]UPZ16034.1 glycosyltransferase family 4 protein [Flavobacterium humidisoli]